MVVAELKKELWHVMFFFLIYSLLWRTICKRVNMYYIRLNLLCFLSEIVCCVIMWLNMKVLVYCLLSSDWVECTTMENSDSLDCGSDYIHQNSMQITCGKYTIYICYIWHILAKSQQAVFPNNYFNVTTDIPVIFLSPLFISQLVRFSISHLTIWSQYQSVIPPSYLWAQCLKLTHFLGGANAWSAIDLVKMVLHKASGPLGGIARTMIARLDCLAEPRGTTEAPLRWLLPTTQRMTMANQLGLDSCLLMLGLIRVTKEWQRVDLMVR